MMMMMMMIMVKHVLWFYSFSPHVLLTIGPAPRLDEACGIMVRNLPGTMNRDTLRGLFARYGTIIDTHIKPTHDGRAYAFVVFSNEAARNSALRDPPLVEGRPALVAEKRRGVGRGRRGSQE